VAPPPPPPPPRESELLASIAARSAGLGAAFLHVEVGPGDDCAVLRAPAGDRLLISVDQLIAGVHFRPPPATPLELIGRKAIARALSDIAAMAGRPLGAVIAACLPCDFGSADELFAHTKAAADGFGCPLIGGDIAIADAPLALTTTVFGVAATARGPALRSEARPGDLVYVTGELGGSLDAATGLGRHLTFSPRLAEGVWLAETLGERLGSMIDLSDGLGIDSGRLAAASGVRLELDARAVPLAETTPGIDWRRALGDGEDYELLFTVRPGAELPGATPGGTRLTRIGIVREAAGGDGEPGSTVITPEGERVDAAGLGWDHGQQ
jgi:thiamine-monophosphate kinase